MSKYKPLTSCYLCGGPPVAEVIHEPERKKRDKRTGIMTVIPAETLPVCADHADVMEHQPIFYECGCDYVEGESKCVRHNRQLGSISKMRLKSRGTKLTVHGANSKSVK